MLACKLTVILVNVLVFVLSLSLVSIGVWVQADPDSHRVFSLAQEASHDPLFNTASALLITVGVLLTFLSLFGCCGAFQESRCVLRVYVALMLLVCLAEITAVILAVIYKNYIVYNLGSRLLPLLTPQRFYGDADSEGNPKSLGFLMNFAQHKLECCGVFNYSDYINAGFGQPIHEAHVASPDSSVNLTSVFSEEPPYDTSTRTPPAHSGLPYSCCRLHPGAEWKSPQSSDVEDLYRCNKRISPHFHTEGCEEKLKGWLSHNAILLIALGCVLLVLQVMVMVAAACLCRLITKNNYY